MTLVCPMGCKNPVSIKLIWPDDSERVYCSAHAVKVMEGQRAVGVPITSEPWPTGSSDPEPHSHAG